MPLVRLSQLRRQKEFRQVDTNLRETIVVWEEDRKHCADPKEVLNLESIEIRIMRRFVIVEHEVNDVGRRADKKELECGEVQRLGECPEEVWRGVDALALAVLEKDFDDVETDLDTE
jgi:hypothetical protein